MMMTAPPRAAGIPGRTRCQGAVPPGGDASSPAGSRRRGAGDATGAAARPVRRPGPTAPTGTVGRSR